MPLQINNFRLPFQLDSITDEVATRLRMCGVKPDEVVAIYMQKCLDYVIAYISILKAGGLNQVLVTACAVYVLWVCVCGNGVSRGRWWQ